MATADPKSFAILTDRESFYDGWDKYYEGYKKQGDAAWGDKPPQWVTDAIIAFLKPGQSLADFGAGDARNSLGLVADGRSLTLVDISSPGLERASSRAQALGVHPKPTLVVAGLDHLPLVKEQFDAALCIDALPQVQRPLAALQEMARTLVPGGILIVNVFTPRDCAFGEGEPLSARSFLYKNTLFNFFEDDEFRPLLRGLFEVVECRNVRWDDPPHIPFRPVPHTHDALVYVLKKP